MKVKTAFCKTDYTVSKGVRQKWRQTRDEGKIGFRSCSRCTHHYPRVLRQRCIQLEGDLFILISPFELHNELNTLTTDNHVFQYFKSVSVQQKFFLHNVFQTQLLAYHYEKYWTMSTWKLSDIWALLTILVYFMTLPKCSLFMLIIEWCGAKMGENTGKESIIILSLPLRISAVKTEQYVQCIPNFFVVSKFFLHFPSIHSSFSLRRFCLL